MDTHRIEKKILLHASIARVWSAISDAKEFGAWFGVAFDGAFTAGARLRGRIVPTTVDADIARLQQPHAGKQFEFLVDRIEPMRSIWFHWHPFAVEPGVDYSAEPMTLIVFELQQAAGDTLLKISESGFDQLPEARRAQAFAANDRGWSMQTRLIEKYLAAQPTAQ
jgi:uncharacterized protein YndB with AHSA1/START domain